MSYLGLDVGTTGCKAALFDRSGKLLSAAYREYPIISQIEGWAEIDSQLVRESCLAVIKEAASHCSYKVRALSISSQGEAFTPIGRNGEILCNAMVSSDARAASVIHSFGKKFGLQRLYDITGHTAHPMFTLFKLLWLRDNQPDIWSSARRFYCFEELIQHALGVEPSISYPLAGRTMMLDVRTHRWDDEILSSLELEPSKLASPKPSGEVVGVIPTQIACELGLSEHTIVVAGGHDQPCGALGSGVTDAGRAMYATGTVECLCAAFAQPVFARKLFDSNLCTYDYTIPGMFTTIAFSLTGGNLLKWFRDEWGYQEIQEAARTGSDPYDLLLEAIPNTPTNLMTLPYFTPSGTPYFETDVKGAILGLSLSSTRGEVLRSLLEGVAFEMRLNLDIMSRSGIKIDELVAVGGGAKSKKWTQLKADVLNRPITTVAVTEAGCLGAAILARAGDTGEDIKSVANKWVQTTDVIEPNRDHSDVYDARFADYVRLYPALKKLSAERRGSDDPLPMSGRPGSQ